MPAKCLITGMPNTGKTTLLKTLPHVNVNEYTNMNNFLALVSDKLEAYNKRFGTYPETIAFDSVSRIFTDVETSCSKRFNGYEVWANVNKEIQTFLEAINSMQENGFNENAKKYIETCKGSFAKIGGFLSVTDYALNIDLVGNKHIITHRGSSLSRTLLDDIPDKQNADDFNLQEYIDKIANKSNEVAEKWSI